MWTGGRRHGPLGEVDGGVAVGGVPRLPEACEVRAAQLVEVRPGDGFLTRRERLLAEGDGLVDVPRVARTVVPEP
ncbi:hypothetical protein PV416_09930 [Streptomyces ipomoeae]|uniref:hypothetical protein n=1 Tax=Streptomyces ipomoeae TaxID=103232 RepID=UPI0029BE257C|nr:hypothetical protein [Streptomyces ipomoeae]MDX2821399.1 hypothetical protein [Streptomyces ipomoeae]MDX2839618.1 hypothetical protein [Streptomyces ipomoeae]